MARRKLKYFPRAFFKPDTLDVFHGLTPGLDSWGKGLGYAQAWHKGNSIFCQNCVANEFICAEIGRMLQLPIPSFGITYRDEGGAREPLFSSLDFNFNRAKLPVVEPSKCAEHLPELSAGVLVFDILIANSDRHDENIIVDKVSHPKHMQIFDHGHALLGPVKDEGIVRLQELEGRLGVTGGAVSEGIPHVLLDAITTCEHFEPWANKIKDIPDWFVAGTCNAAIELG